MILGKTYILIGLVLMHLSRGLLAGPLEDSEAIKFFEMKIRPVLAENCYECHGEKKGKGGLRLDNLGYLLEGGETGPALVPGDSAKSHMLRSISYTDPDNEMPPDGKLPDAQIADIKRWIDMGAPWPAAEIIAPRKPGEFTAEERGWWSFQPLKKVTPPDIAAGSDVDRFVIAKLNDAGLEQAPEARPPRHHHAPARRGSHPNDLSRQTPPRADRPKRR